MISDASAMCLELALEGERLCKSGDCNAGVVFFQAAIQAGTDDLRTLSAIYSQLGNAYFYLADYAKAMQYHNLDLTLTRSMDDKLGEAKSSGNLGNTLKVMGRFDEAAICCDRHLTLARQLGDRLSEGKALYNLGNVYHAKGKHFSQSDSGDFCEEVKDSLLKAVEFYQQNFCLMKELGDRDGQGRAYGNLGNTYYLLGNFEAAIEHYQERLSIAREFGDKSAERRANSNLGNSHIFLAQFDGAAEYYKRTLSLAIELGERAVEAQVCYSLGNTYTLLRDFPIAIEYHMRHLSIAQEFGDKVGEARACWSLVNAHSMIENHENALQFAQQHYSLARGLGDTVGEATARMNMSDLRKMLGILNLPNVDDTTMENGESSTNEVANVAQSTALNVTRESSSTRRIRIRRQSMEQLDLIKLTPDGKRMNAAAHNIIQDSNLPNENNANVQKATATNSIATNKPNEEVFIDLLTRTHSKRMDDQRCLLKAIDKESVRKPLVQQNSLPGLVPSMRNLHQHRHMGAPINTHPTVANPRGSSTAAATNEPAPNDAFLDMLWRCQLSRLEEQRFELSRPNNMHDVEQGESTRECINAGATVPDEDFFSLIMRVQGGRMEDQRAAVPFNTRKSK